MATAKSYHVIGHDGLLYANIGGKEIPVGGIKFKLSGSDLDFMTMEAPYGADIFTSMMWKYNSNTFVTLTTEKDNSPEKLQVYRDTSSHKIDLHWLRNMRDKDFSYEYKISNYRSNFIEKDFEIDTATIQRLSEKRDIAQVVYRKWEDDSAVNAKTLHQLVLEILKVHKSGPIAINCFAGLHRTKTVILALYIYDLKTKNENITAESAIEEYQKAVLSDIIKENGEQAPAWSDKKHGQWKLIVDYVEFLKSQNNTQKL